MICRELKSSFTLMMNMLHY